jgi:hypothetical protein
MAGKKKKGNQGLRKKARINKKMKKKLGEESQHKNFDYKDKEDKTLFYGIITRVLSGTSFNVRLSQPIVQNKNGKEEKIEIIHALKRKTKKSYKRGEKPKLDTVIIVQIPLYELNKAKPIGQIVKGLNHINVNWLIKKGDLDNSFMKKEEKVYETENFESKEDKLYAAVSTVMTFDEDVDIDDI